MRPRPALLRARLSVLAAILAAAFACGLAATDAHAIEPVVRDIPIPNAGFEILYKPGSSTITASIPEWTTAVGPCAALHNATVATYSDGTAGTRVDIPGWIGAGAINAGLVPDTGSYGYAANGGSWAAPNGEMIASAQPVATITPNTTYTLTARIGAPNGDGRIAGPLILELFTETGSLTPSSSSLTEALADPMSEADAQVEFCAPKLSGHRHFRWFTHRRHRHHRKPGDDVVTPPPPPPVESYPYETVSLTFDADSLADRIGESLSIRLGTGEEAFGTQIDFDNISLTATTVPEPMTLALLGLGGMTMLWKKSRRSKT